MTVESGRRMEKREEDSENTIILYNLFRATMLKII